MPPTLDAPGRQVVLASRGHGFLGRGRVDIKVVDPDPRGVIPGGTMQFHEADQIVTIDGWVLKNRFGKTYCHWTRVPWTEGGQRIHAILSHLGHGLLPAVQLSTRVW